jgi:hypothetical protein
VDLITRDKTMKIESQLMNEKSPKGIGSVTQKAKIAMKNFFIMLNHQIMKNTSQKVKDLLNSLYKNIFLPDK